MFHLSAVPEIGLGSKTLCDICMRNKSSEYYDCGMHKMCDKCHQRFASMKQCPLCTKCNQRVIEKTMGRNSMCSPMNLQEPCPVLFDHLMNEDNQNVTPCSSEGSLLNSLSSELSSDSDDLINAGCPCGVEDDYDDPFAALDAEFEKQQMLKSNTSYNGLYHCSYSIYNSFMNQDYCPSDDHLKSLLLPLPKTQPINAAFVSCCPVSVHPEVSNDSIEPPRKMLQKSQHLSSTEFRRMIDICKDL